MKNLPKIFLLFFCVFNLKLQAVKYYVNDASVTNDIFCTAPGNAANNGLSPSTPKLTLASVLTSYSASFNFGDTILIDAGNYVEIQLSSPINGVVIRGAGVIRTVITKSGSDRYFMLINDNNTVLMDMKLIGYDNQTVSGVQALGVANNTTGVKIINVQVDGCSTTSTLGGYPVEIGTGCTVLLNRGGVTCNTWDAGGGIHISGSTTSVTISNYQFIGNYQLFNNGTALKISAGTVNIYNSRFESNTIGGDKSGVGIDVTTGTVNVYDSYFYKNQTNILSNNIGGAVSVHGGIFRITRSVFSGNVPQPATSGIYGAGIGVTGGTVTIDSCGFTGNVGARANDVYVNGGTVLTRNCTFGSAANQIGIAGGTFSITTCGTPSEYGTGIFHFNNNPPTYTAVPQLPDYLPVSCVVIPCTNPVITSAAPTSTLCSGGNFSTNLTASTTSAQTTYSWVSTVVAGITGHSTSGVNNINETLVNTGTVALTISYSVTPTFNLSCNGTTVVYSVTIYPLSTVSVASSSLCSGNSATVSPTGASTYTLLPLNLTGTSFVITPSVSSTYTVNGLTANGCNANNTIFSITVNSTPTINITSLTNSVICSGSSSIITPVGATTYTLLPGNINGTTFSVSPASSTIYTISGASSAGCVSVNSLTVPITVNPSPNISILSVSNPTFCVGNSSIIQPTGASNYTLLPGNQTGTSFTVTPASTTTYTISGSSSFGCLAANNVTTQILVVPNPTLSMAALTSTALCQGNSVIVVPSGASTYTILPTLSIGNSFTITPVSTSVYTVNGSSSGGCLSANSLTFQLTVNPNPTVSISSNTNTVLCAGDSSIITPVGASTYTMLPGNISGTSFTVTPASSTVYTISGTSSNGCVSVNPITVMVNVNPTPTISLLSVSNSTLCGGNSSVIQPTGASNYTLIPGNQTGTAFTVTPTSTTTYTIIGGNTFGCLATNNVTTTLLVTPNPTISLASITSAAICTGDSVVIVPSGASTYTLLPSLSTGNTFTVTPGSTSVYTISGTNAAGCLSANSPTFQITVNPIPIINISSITNPVLCYGDSSIITPSGASTYTLLPGNVTGTTFTVTPPATATYSILGTSAAGCLSSNVATISVMVNNNPTVTLNSVPNASICPGTSLTLVPGGAATYTLIPGNTTGNSFTINPATNTTYSVTGTSSMGCLSQNTATVAVFIYSAITLTATASSPVLCTSDQYTLNVNSTSSPLTYTWNGYGINASNQNLSAPVINASTLSAGVYVYTVIAGSAEGCTSQPYTASVNIITQPNSSFSLSPLSLCQNAQGILMIDNPQAGVSYTWNVNGIISMSSSSVSITSSLTTTPGFYTVSVLAALGSCSNTSTGTFTVNALPTVQLSANNYTGCIGSNYIVNVINPVSGAIYNWYFENNNIANGVTYNLNNLSLASTGTYSVIVTDANSCKATVTISVDVVSCTVFVPEIFTPNGDGKNDTFEIKHIEDYPNNNLKIFNRWGNLIYEKNGYKNEFDGHANVGDRIGSDKLPVGTYYVFLIFNDGKTSEYSGILQLQY